MLRGLREARLSVDDDTVFHDLMHCDKPEFVPLQHAANDNMRPTLPLEEAIERVIERSARFSFRIIDWQGRKGKIVKLK